MLPVVLSKHLIAASANCIALSQTVAVGASVVLNGGSVVSEPIGPFGKNINVGQLDTQRRIALVSGGNDSAATVTIKGFADGGPSQQISEVLPLTNAGTALSNLDYLGITSIMPSAAIASTIIVGTDTTGSTPWIVPNYHATPFEINVFDEVTGSVTWNFETTNDGCIGPDPKTGATPQPHVDVIISGSTTAQATTLTSPVSGYRLTVTAGTGTIAAQAIQAGISNY